MRSSSRDIVVGFTVTGRSFVALGAPNLVFATVGVPEGESGEFGLLLLALPLLAWGVVALRCRGILDSPRPAPALGSDREAASGFASGPSSSSLQMFPDGTRPRREHMTSGRLARVLLAYIQWKCSVPSFAVNLRAH